MKKTEMLLTFTLCLFLLVPSLAYTKVMWYSSQELTQKSDLVINGEVVKIEPSGKIKNEYGLKGRISYATLKMLQAIKGNSDTPTVIVEFVKFNDFVGGAMVEPDCQDAQFQVGEKGIAYLKKLQNGNYVTTAGWGQGFRVKQFK